MSREITELLGKAFEAHQQLCGATGDPKRLKKAMEDHTKALAALYLAIEQVENARDRYKNAWEQLRDAVESIAQ